MAVDCYRINVPDNARLAGFTAAGQRVFVVPGEHVVHRVRPKVPLKGVVEALRFVGADENGRDVHIPVQSEAEFRALLQPAGTIGHGGAGASWG